ncbi:polyhydroxybutyrate depolymerase [Rhodoblastus acidophilus]|uniref:alpha/beta hydrolase family esterase n=1 Tax=Rhodoblastus acidophilus TaxID=1074 RepID=UPI0022242D48|nr:phospholipase [Rhodoblastus acidophilus]MCW2285279.1 polyhydroxybutyrate depolymerase [Rhodoblastus acidophilus]MCW2334235.1 polyhydroxybutyrate depolymerase [Rhodoblastus acidophilus]
MISTDLFRAGRAAAALGLALFLLDAAPAEAAARLTLSSGGVSRAAVIVERERLKLRRRPLIIVLQRSGGVVARGRRHHGLEQFAGAKPIFVYPEALGGHWPVTAGPDSDRELAFLRQLTEHLIAQGRVDPRRIFVVGVGSGGPLAFRAACAGVGRPIAGLATVASAMPQDLTACEPAAPLAYIAVNSAQDAKIPFAGGKATAGDTVFDAFGAEQTLQTFAKINSCGARRDVKDARTRGAIASFSGCKAPTELIRLDAGAHHTPGRAPDNGEASDYFDANRTVWDFLQHSGA